METGDFAVVHADGSMRFFFFFLGEMLLTTK
jgi:hypothetical protein